MVSFRDFILGQPSKDENENPEEVKQAAKSEEKASKWVSGKNYSPSELERLIEDDTVYHRKFTTGKFAQHRDSLTKLWGEIIAEKKKSGGTFSKSEIEKKIRELKTKGGDYKLLAESLEGLL